MLYQDIWKGRQRLLLPPAMVSTLLVFPFPHEFIPSFPRKDSLLVNMKGSCTIPCTEAVKLDGYLVLKVCMYFCPLLFWGWWLLPLAGTPGMPSSYQCGRTSMPAAPGLRQKRGSCGDSSHNYTITSSMKRMLRGSACLGSWLCH